MSRRVVLASVVSVVLALLVVLPTEAQTTTTEGERLARLEEAYKHLATKEDIAELRGEFAELRGEFRGMQWAMGVGFLVVIGVTVWVNRDKRPNYQSESNPLSVNPQIR